MRRIGIVVKEDQEAVRKADELESWLGEKGIKVIRKVAVSPTTLHARRTSHAPPDLFCIFVLGGDGTFLSAVHWAGQHDIPLIGVKFGGVGFLSELTEERLYSAAEAVLNGEFTIDIRMRLEVVIHRDGTELVHETVLNDVVINKGALARLASIETSIDDHFLTTFKGDGLIISTPTGSTAYSLAAGGPAIHPTVPGIVITPICPFTLTNRPLIIPDSACIKMQLKERASDIKLTFDGQTGFEICDKDTIVVRKALNSIRVITLSDYNYFDVLKTKLHWSGNSI